MTNGVVGTTGPLSKLPVVGYEIAFATVPDADTDASNKNNNKREKEDAGWLPLLLLLRE